MSIMFVTAILLAAVGPKLPPIPVAVAGNAVTSLKAGHSTMIYSLMGIGPKKTWDDVTNAVHILDVDGARWLDVRAVPGVAGRVGAIAAAAKDLVVVFGGYVLDAQGGAAIVPDVNVYSPESHRWYRGADLPVPVDDAIAGVTHDRYVYLIGGRSKSGLLNKVQLYDAEKNTWSEATPSPGAAVFGHAGAIVDDTIVYVDGAARNPAAGAAYVASEECWIGKIDHKDPAKIIWSKLPAHPGTARFGIAAGASEKEHKIYFSGGSDRPHNFLGMGYDGQPAEPSPVTFAYDVRFRKWETIHENTPDPTMDHSVLVATSEGLIILGGMEKGQTITARVSLIPRK